MLIAKRGKGRSELEGNTAGNMRAMWRAVLLLTASHAAIGAAYGPEGCLCPQGQDEMHGWLTCIGLDAEERARLLDEGWMVQDFREMTLEDAAAALHLKRAKAWRIARCGKGSEGHHRQDPGGRTDALEARSSHSHSDGREEDGCHINLYGGLYFPNYYFTLVADMPAYCGCKVV